MKTATLFTWAKPKSRAEYSDVDPILSESLEQDAPAPAKVKLVSPAQCEESRNIKLLVIGGPFALLALFLAAVAALFGGITEHPPGTVPNSNYPYCAPNGQVQYYSNGNGTYWADARYWNPSLWFTVTLGVGGLSFSEAKMIDIAFDLVVGRGSQLLFAWGVYHVIRRALYRSMEVKGISYTTMHAIYLDGICTFTLWTMISHSVQSLFKSGKPPRKNKARRGSDWRLYLVFIIVLFIVASPTFLSAATSYQTSSIPFVQMPNSQDWVEVSSLPVVLWLILDGDRIGLAANYSVLSGDPLATSVNSCEYSFPSPSSQH